MTVDGGVELKLRMSKGSAFAFYGGRRSVSVLFSALVAMSVCLGASGEIKINWYIPENEAVRLEISSE